MCESTAPEREDVEDRPVGRQARRQLLRDRLVSSTLDG
jgi:hypothetical protein